jgi:hypothetical protein
MAVNMALSEYVEGNEYSSARPQQFGKRTSTYWRASFLLWHAD